MGNKISQNLPIQILFTNVATEGFVHKMYIAYVSKLLQIKKEQFFFAPNINLFNVALKKYL